MIFSNQIISIANQLASRLAELNVNDISAQEILLASASGLPMSSNELEKMRLNINFQQEDKILTIIATLSEFARLRSSKALPPLDLIDIIGHVFSDLPKSKIICHTNGSLPLALWYSSLNFEVYYTGNENYCPHISEISSKTVKYIHDFQHEEALHIVLQDAEPAKANSTIRKITKSSYIGLFLLTNWSFLSSTNPTNLQIKQKFITSNKLRAVVQFPCGYNPKILPACILLNSLIPCKDDKIKLINAKDWTYQQKSENYEVRYPQPILDVFLGENMDKYPQKPPMEEISTTDLLLRHCDLRMKDPTSSTSNKLAQETLSSCASLIRGQMLSAKAGKLNEMEYREVVLNDIDDFGFIQTASRVLSNMPALPRSRDLARVRVNDILITFKGSLQSLGKIGLVLYAEQNFLPNQSFYIIRAENIDPIWLYYYLKSDKAQSYFCMHSSGTSIPQLQVADISTINIPIPTQEELEILKKYHAQVLLKRKKMQAIKEDISKLNETALQLVS